MMRFTPNPFHPPLRERIFARIPTAKREFDTLLFAKHLTQFPAGSPVPCDGQSLPVCLPDSIAIPIPGCPPLAFACNGRGNRIPAQLRRNRSPAEEVVAAPVFCAN